MNTSKVKDFVANTVKAGRSAECVRLAVVPNFSRLESDCRSLCAPAQLIELTRIHFRSGSKALLGAQSPP